MSTPARDLFAITVGTIRLASGVSLLVSPDAANRLWGGDPGFVGPTASLLLRSMGYRDALVGAMLLRAGLRNDTTTAGWFLASGGADLTDLVGGIANHDRLSKKARQIGLTGAAVGVAVGLLGSARAGRRR